MKILSALFLILLFTVLASAQTATVIAENANLRGTASQSGKVVQMLPEGTTLEVIKQSGAWFLVQAPDFAGWIHGNAIRLVGGRTNVSTSIPRTNPVRVRPSPSITKPSPVVTQPTGATARCRDGTLSYSRNRRGTCSHHGGVAQWY